MKLLIPVDAKNEEDASIVPYVDAKYWAFIDITEGRMISCEFVNSFEDIKEPIACVILKSDKEDCVFFMEQNINILIAHSQSSIEDIVEGFIFKELYEILT